MKLSRNVRSEVTQVIVLLAAQWNGLNQAAWLNCKNLNMMEYPMVQGTSNQFALERIALLNTGEHKVGSENILAWLALLNNDDSELTKSAAALIIFLHKTINAIEMFFINEGFDYKKDNQYFDFKCLLKVDYKPVVSPSLYLRFLDDT
jgi:hypothetical protein